MFDIGWSELLVVGVVALIVVGPKELPRLFRTVGQFVGKARGMAREFQRAMDRAADEAGVKDVKETFQEASKTTSFGFDDIRKTLNSSTLPDQKKPKPVDAAREHAERMKDKGEIKGNGSENSIAPTEEPAPQSAAPRNAERWQGRSAGSRRNRAPRCRCKCYVRQYIVDRRRRHSTRSRSFHRRAG